MPGNCIVNQFNGKLVTLIDYNNRNINVFICRTPLQQSLIHDDKSLSPKFILLGNLLPFDFFAELIKIVFYDRGSLTTQNSLDTSNQRDKLK